MRNSQGSEGNFMQNKDFKRCCESSDCVDGEENNQTSRKTNGNVSTLWFYAFMFTLYECVLVVFDMTHKTTVPEWAYFVPFFFMFGLPVAAIVVSVAMLVCILCFAVVLVLGGGFGWVLVMGAIALWERLVNIFRQKKPNDAKPN